MKTDIKTSRYFPLLMLILTIAIIAGLVLITGILQNQNKEINMLRTRVTNLEIVINSDYFNRPEDTNFNTTGDMHL